MPVHSSSSRAQAPSAGVHFQATRALRRAETNDDAVVAIATSARDLAQMVQQCSAEVARLEQRRRTGASLEGQRGQHLVATQLDLEAAALHQYGQVLARELAGAKEDLAQLGPLGGRQGQGAQLSEQLGRDAQDVDDMLADLQGVLEGRLAASSVVSDRDAQLRGAPRRQNAEQELQVGQAARAQAGQDEQRQPPQALLAELASFVKDWDSVVKDPRGLDKAGSETSKTDGRVAAIQGRWAEWNLRTKAPAMMDPNEMTQWVMNQAYRDNTEDMRAYAVRLEFHTSVKANLRDELARARKHRSDFKGQGDKHEMKQAFARKKVHLDPRVDEDGNWHLRALEDDGKIVDAEVLQEYIRELEQSLQTAGEDMQLAQIQLQTMTQRQQQVLNTLSSLSKAQHETSMAILRKIGS